MIWLWVILFGVDLLLIYGVFLQLVQKQPFGNKPLSNPGLLAITAFKLLLTLFFLLVRLETRITDSGIAVRLFPFHLRFREYPWKAVYRCSVWKYNPIRDLGGWGVRIGFFGKGRALTVGGHYGIQLEFTNGSRLLIGTRKQREVSTILSQMVANGARK